jgi:type I restriction enzyme S subunit
LGRVAICDGQEVCINQSVALLRIRGASTEFIAEALQASAYQEMMIFNAGGTTIKHIYITRLVKMRIAMPPTLEEQKDLASEIRTVTTKFARAVNTAQREIALMQEYRTRLTADLVAGKLDVREAAAQLPEVSGGNVEVGDDTSELEDP